MICQALNKNRRAFLSGAVLLIIIVSGFCFFFPFYLPRVGALRGSSSWKLSFNLRLTDPPWLWGSREDADIMWFRNPFHQFLPDADFQIACDSFNGNSSDINNLVNGGFNYVKSNHRTIQFYGFWYNSGKFHPTLHDQDVLNIIKKKSFIKEIGLKTKFLDTIYFGGFCEPSKDMNKVCTMHANCCVGLGNKLSDLRLILDDWRNYTALTTDGRRIRPPNWRAPKCCTM